MLYAKDMERVAGFYEAVLGLRRTGHDADHVVLESPALQLVVLAIPRHIAVNVEITVPPARRERAAVCDGLDPEGNVVQFRTRRGDFS